MEGIVECTYRQFQQVESIYAALYGAYHVSCHNMTSLMNSFRDRGL